MNQYHDHSCEQEENDALRCQLEAFKHEVDLIKADLKTEVEQKDQQIRELQEVRKMTCFLCLNAADASADLISLSATDELSPQSSRYLLSNSVRHRTSKVSHADADA